MEEPSQFVGHGHFICQSLLKMEPEKMLVIFYLVMLEELFQETLTLMMP